MLFTRRAPASDVAIACLLCGIGSIVFGCIGLPLGVAAIVTGLVAFAEIRTSGRPGSGLVSAGSAAGIVGIVLCVLIWTNWGMTLASGIVGAITNS